MAYVKRSLEQLIEHEDPAWPLVQAWVAQAKHPAEILSPAETAGESLVSIQASTRSPLGAVVFHTGGILVDHGWIRLLGSGGDPVEQRHRGTAPLKELFRLHIGTI